MRHEFKNLFEAVSLRIEFDPFQFLDRREEEIDEDFKGRRWGVLIILFIAVAIMIAIPVGMIALIWLAFFG